MAAISPASMASMTAAEPNMTMVRTTRNDNTVHHLLPAGFEPCSHDRTCPSCSSTLILKAPTSSDTANDAKTKNLSASATELDNSDLQSTVRGNLASSLESAHSANLLLEAMSFDAATREERQGLELEQPVQRVPYCPECKVHVITSPKELERLFDEYENDSQVEDGSRNMEWLRGSLLVTVDDAEVMALQSRRGHPASNNNPPFQSQCSPSHHDSPPLSGQEPSHSEVTMPRHLQPKPTRPLEFDYEYRHKVATHAMASRLDRGYTLLDDICPECEMPLMKINRKRECVVCPKLLKKVAKYHGSTQQQHQPHYSHDHHEQSWQQEASSAGQIIDPISAIIANARSEAPHSSRARRMVQPDIAEAKQYVMQRRIMNGTAVKSPNHRSDDAGGFRGNNKKASGGGGCNISEVGSHGTGSLTDHTALTAEDHLLAASGAGGMMYNPINWEELLINGRTILSKRLNEGWILSSTNCSGGNCKGTPLLQQLDGEYVDLDYCAVCGGSGSGEDGAYEREIEWQAKAAELAEQAEREACPNWDELAGNGRALLSERLKQGWIMSSENCCGYHCNEMPLTNIEGGPSSCVVCGGSGNGCDGAYENYKPDEVVEEERAMVSQELSHLLSMGWVLRESLCVQCLMPLVAEEEDAGEDLCILCGHLNENNPHSGNDDDFGDVDDVDDSYINEPYIDEILNEAVNAPVPTFGADNTNEAGKRLISGWTLPDAGLCHHCHGIQMSAPNSHEIGCINRGCPSALAAAYTFLPKPHESTGPVILVGRGFSNAAKEEEEEMHNANAAKAEEQAAGQLFKSQLQNEAFYHHENTHHAYEEQYMEGRNYKGPPLEVCGGRQDDPGFGHDEPSVLSDDLTQVRSVASSALGVILVRLDDAKYELQAMRENDNADQQECAQKQVEIATLIEKLASAAVQMKQKEGYD